MRTLTTAACALIALTSAASADFIQGTLSMWPKATVSGSGDSQTINFTGGQQFPPSFTSGDLTPFENSLFTIENIGATIPWQQFTAGDPSLGCGPTCVALGSNGVLNWSFNVTSHSLRDTPHAPIVFYEWAPTSGFANGIINVTLGANRITQVRSNGAVVSEGVVVAHLRGSVQAALNLRRALDRALSAAVGAQTPPKGKTN
jgi:hypothetical protein